MSKINNPEGVTVTETIPEWAVELKLAVAGLKNDTAGLKAGLKDNLRHIQRCLGSLEDQQDRIGTGLRALRQEVHEEPCAMSHPDLHKAILGNDGVRQIRPWWKNSSWIN